MKLSNKERVYRSKIIAENHLKKDGQRYLDQYTKSKSLTYKALYLNYGELRSMLIKYGISKLGNALKDVGVSCTQAASAFQKMTASLATIAIDLKDNFKEENYDGEQMRMLW